VVPVAEGGRAGDTANVDVRVDDDVATLVGGCRYATGICGTSWVVQGGVGGGSSRRCRWWGWRSRSVGYTTRSGERVCSSSCNSVCWAVGGRRGLSGARVAISGVVGAVWVLTVAQVVVSRVVSAGNVGVGSGDVAVAGCGSRCETGGLGVDWGAVGRFGSVCRRLRGAGGSFEARAELVVVVLDVVDIVDGTDGAVASDDVAVNGDGGGLVAVVWVLESTRSVVSAFFVEVEVSSSGGSVCRAAHRRSWAGLVCTAVSTAVGAAWVLTLTVVVTAGVVWTSTLLVVTSSVWVSASSSKTAPRNSSRAWAAIVRQSPAPCPSVSHFFRSSSFPSCVPSP
jgi:hypothetical protein